MDRIFLSGAVQNEPNIPDDVDPGYPTDGSSGGGVASTIPGAIWYNAVMMELINAIKGGGVTPDRHDNAQLDAAIKAQIKTVNQALSDAVAQIQAKVAQVEIVPAGAIMFFPTSSSPNANWLICNGQAISRTAYASLFSVIGTKYGSGNGSTTFNVPYLIDKTVWGGQGNVGEQRSAGLPNITGSVGLARRGGNEGYRFDGAFSESGRFNAKIKHGDNDDWGSFVDFNAAKSNGIYGRSGTVQPPALVLLPCIHI